MPPADLSAFVDELPFGEHYCDFPRVHDFDDCDGFPWFEPGELAEGTRRAAYQASRRCEAYLDAEGAAPTADDLQLAILDKAIELWEVFRWHLSCDLEEGWTWLARLVVEEAYEVAADADVLPLPPLDSLPQLERVMRLFFAEVRGSSTYQHLELSGWERFVNSYLLKDRGREACIDSPPDESCGPAWIINDLTIVSSPSPISAADALSGHEASRNRQKRLQEAAQKREMLDELELLGEIDFPQADDELVQQEL